MLIDKKRERMFANCLQMKKKLDKKLAAARAYLLALPVLFLIVTLIVLAMYLLRGALYTLSGATAWGAIAAPPEAVLFVNLIGGCALLALGAELTVFRNELALRYYVGGYCAIIIISFAAFVVFGMTDTVFIPIFSLFAIAVGKWNEKLTNQDIAMSKLDGYPHFNPALMRHHESPRIEITKEQIENMDPEERIMMERDGRL